MKTFFALLIMACLSVLSIPGFAQYENLKPAENRPEPGGNMVAFNETFFARHAARRSPDPLIAAMVNAINTDSLRATLTELQSWGSRFLMNDNHREIAVSLQNRFLAYGYTDVKLDSFYLAIQNWNGLHDSAWQYNVVCTLRGRSAPDEIYVTGGHWDSFSTTDPFHEAPGVNDNGTAVAATLEMARVMRQFNYQPEATVRMVLYAAEELGLFGSRYAAATDRQQGKDIRYMLNLDMISNNPENLQQVKIYRYLGFEWAGNVAADATQRYTGLSVVFPSNNANSGSDSYPYWLEGFPSAYYEEIHFSPNWHLPSDTVGNCNIPYLRQVTGGALATLAEQQRLPHPRNLTSHSASESVHLQWLPTDNAFVAGYNIYRSDSAGGTFQKINTLPVNDTMYSDIPPLVNKQFYYSITTVNDSLEESGLSNEVIGARINFCDSLLVIANTKGTKTTPDSVRAFYQAVLDTIPYRWVDANALFQPDLNLLSRYRTIFWMSNTIEAESMNTTLYQSMMAFTENGGNLLFAGFNPGKFWIGSQVPYPLDVPEDIYFHGCFKIDSIDKKVQSMLCGANAAAEGYEALSIDSSKCMDKNFPGQIYNIEVYTPDDPGTVIYRFDSRYDSVTSYGKMKHRPVGIEYMGTDHKSILLSFPLWYLDTADAHRFVHFVMNRKFRTHTGLADLRGHSGIGLEVYPNPARREVTIQIHPLREGVLQLSLASAEGRVFPVTTQRVPAGSGQIRFAAALLPPGQYQVVAVYEGFTETCKLIIVR